MILSNKWITKALISLCGCTDWSAPLLFANPEHRFFAISNQMLEYNKVEELMLIVIDIELAQIILLKSITT